MQTNTNTRLSAIKCFLFFLFFSLFLATPAPAGVFGTEKGDPAEKFGNLEPIDTRGAMSVYATKAIAKNPFFDALFLIFIRNRLAGVLALSESVRDPACALTRKRYKAMKEYLIRKYGPPNKEEEEISVGEKENHFHAYLESNFSMESDWMGIFPNDVYAIHLKISAEENDKSYMTALYIYNVDVASLEEFSKWDSYRKWNPYR